MFDQMHILTRELVRRYPEAVGDFRIADPPRARPYRDAWGKARRPSAAAFVFQALRRQWLRLALREA